MAYFWQPQDFPNFQFKVDDLLSQMQEFTTDPNYLKFKIWLSNVTFNKNKSDSVLPSNGRIEKQNN